MGVGIGVDAEAKAGSANITVSALYNYDLLSLRGDDGFVSAGKKRTASFGMEAELFNQTIGREWGGYSYHTYNHNDCSCPRDLLAASSSQIINCPEGIYEEFDASLKPDYTIGIDVKAYYGVGFTYCLEFEVDYFIEQVVAIFSE